MLCFVMSCKVKCSEEIKGKEMKIWKCPECNDEMLLEDNDKVIECTCGGKPQIIKESESEFRHYIKKDV